MARPAKKRPISVTVFWSEANRQWTGFVPEKDAQGKTLRRIKRTCSTPGDEGKEICEDLIREVEDELAEKAIRRAANLPPGGSTKVWRLHAWCRYWLAEIVFQRVAYNTFRDYSDTIEHDVLPHIDDCDLPDLTSTAIDVMVKRNRETGSHDKPHRAYSRLAMALKAAKARAPETGLWHNPIEAVDRPKLETAEVVPPTRDEVRRIIEVAGTRRNRARWTVSWAFGLRQGEALALMRDDFWLVWARTENGHQAAEPVPEHLWYEVDLADVVGVLRVKENLYRRKWLHGCKDPHACGARYHRYPCPMTGVKHVRYHGNGCPTAKKWCKPGCAEHAKSCEHRHGGKDSRGRLMPGGQVRKDPKSEKGKRPLFLAGPPVREMLLHLREQDKERIRAGDRWIGSGALFASKRGGLTNERDDWGEYCDILVAAGVVDAETGKASKRLHDGRHAAATFMRKMKIGERDAMRALGWSSRQMLDRYQHDGDEILLDATNAITSMIWPTEEGSATSPATSEITDLGEWRRRRA